jgi:hypothetical protein
MDETLIHHYTPESKQQSKQWTEAGCFCAKEDKVGSISREGHGIGVLGC